MSRQFVCLTLLFSATAFAQFPTLPHSQIQEEVQTLTSVRGQIAAERGTQLDNLIVEVQLVSGSGQSQRVPVSSSGQFYFDAVEGQSYILRVASQTGGNVIAQQIVTPGPMASVEIALPKPQGDQPITGTVSLYELQHKVPPKALREGREADKYAAKHNMKAYIEHASKALDLDPGWTAARRNLGIAYLATGDNENAVREFREVLKLDPRSLTAYAGLSCSYLQVNKFAEAEDAARRALEIDSTSEASRFYLGVSLAQQHKDESQALQYLEKVSGSFPKAHLAAAKILERLGKKQAAKGELEDYLSSGDPDAQSQVRSWIEQLN